MFDHKAYNFPTRMEDYLHGAEHYQKLSGEWHVFAWAERAEGRTDDADTSQAIAAKYANIARTKMGINPRDYDNGIS